MYSWRQFIASPDPTLNAGLLVASDHSVYIGVITNSVFAILATLLAARRPRRRGQAIVQWGMNVGLLVFVIGLVPGTQVLKQIGAPTMGVCLLIGLALYGGLVGTRTDPAPEALAAAAYAIRPGGRRPTGRRPPGRPPSRPVRGVAGRRGERPVRAVLRHRHLLQPENARWARSASANASANPGCPSPAGRSPPPTTGPGPAASVPAGRAAARSARRSRSP